MKKLSKKKLAGEVIASGGFGCIFKPALACKESGIRTNGISKLVTNEEGLNEYNENKKIKPLIQKIPNYEKYFLLHNISLCVPDTLTETDLKLFDKCKNLEKYNINASNVNNNLNKLSIINFPYGGKDLEKIFEEGEKLDEQKLLIINKALISILKNAIIPMNKLGVIHNDIKITNMLYDNGEMKIIDWGFAIILSKIIPSIIIQRPLQFNLPFSIVLFNQNFKNFYKTELIKLNQENITFSTIKNIVLKYFYKQIYQKGHYSYIFDHIFRELFTSIKGLVSEEKYTNIIKYTYGLNIILDYLSAILFQYTDFKKKEFDALTYYLNVYTKNVDIWGFLTTYLSFLTEIKKKNFIFKSLKVKKQIIQKIHSLLITYLYSNTYATKPINTEKLFIDLQKINNLLNLDKKN